MDIENFSEPMNKVIIVAADFYKDITEELIKGASSALKKEKIKFDIIKVPGALEIPQAIVMADMTAEYDAFIALGCVIRGETYHFEVVANQSAYGLMKLATEDCIIIGNGILTVESEEQAWERADIKKGNKGADAANACIKLLEIRKKLSSDENGNDDDE